jgi:ribA/ribD-fused uncharacterized protein
MERASYFIKDRAIFGSFPTQKAVDELENKGVKFFVNLTYNYEKKITPYVTKHNYITFPISDRRVPQDWKEFARFLIRISDIILKQLKNGELLYIHCKGGHGRSGVVVASLLCYIFRMTPEQALEHTTKYHSKRSVMREKWRKLGSPQTIQQKNFVHKFFDPLHFYRAYLTGYTAGFSTFTIHRVCIDNITYPTAEAAIQAAKNLNDIEYIQKQHARTPLMSKNLGRKTEIRKDWERVCDKITYKIVKYKFDQHNDIRENLLNTGLRPIIQHSRGDSYWGDGGDGTGQNKMGNILTKVREQYYRQGI